MAVAFDELPCQPCLTRHVVQKHMTQVEQSAIRNRLLATLPPGDFALLSGWLRRVDMNLKQVLYEPYQPIKSVYFPETGTVSMFAPLEDGDLVEVGMVGREGMVGLPIILGADSSSAGAVAQIPGTGWHIRAAAAKQVFDTSPTLHSLLLRYALAYHSQVAQTAACNGCHALEKRLARWLLMAHDCAHSDEFPMTQEFIAQMLGVTRVSVSGVAGLLQKAHLIGYVHGRITILDRPGLETASCECYRIVRQQFEHLLG
jgi:CRP-like cAMP-binding protein